MKLSVKILSALACIGLAACGNMIKNENGSQFITQLDSEPFGCTFLYKIESEVSVYDSEDARRYLENRIADQARGGNAYWIVSQRTRPNEWVIFGPERSFVLTANVYECPYPNSVRTVKNMGSAKAVTPVIVDNTPCASGYCGAPCAANSYGAPCR